MQLCATFGKSGGRETGLRGGMQDLHTCELQNRAKANRLWPHDKARLRQHRVLHKFAIVPSRICELLNSTEIWQLRDMLHKARKRGELRGGIRDLHPCKLQNLARDRSDIPCHRIVFRRLPAGDTQRWSFGCSGWKALVIGPASPCSSASVPTTAMLTLELSRRLRAPRDRKYARSLIRKMKETT